MNKPERTIKAGQISGTIWSNNEINSNTGQQFEKKSVKLEKSYKMGTEWKNTTSLKIADIPNAILVLKEIYRTFTIKDSG